MVGGDDGGGGGGINVMIITSLCCVYIGYIYVYRQVRVYIRHADG